MKNVVKPPFDRQAAALPNEVTLSFCFMANTGLPFDLALASAHLAERDPALAKLIGEMRPFDPGIDHTQSPYEALMEAIVYQSISGKAAATIFERVKALSSVNRAGTSDGTGSLRTLSGARLAEKVSGNARVPTPEEVLKLTKRQLRKAGLSGAKILAMRDLAQKTIDGIVPTHDEALKLSDEELIERLDSVRGIGRWTVEMFLIFRLGRPDVLPIHDLGVQKGWSVAYRKKHMPRPKELEKFGERWRPYRTVASWYMWRAFEKAGYGVTNKIKAPRAKRKMRVTITRVKVVRKVRFGKKGKADSSLRRLRSE
jgi:3-methyladenine DNA glycosylase/8-oxoguanine DNA glycosylase